MPTGFSPFVRIEMMTKLDEIYKTPLSFRVGPITDQPLTAGWGRWQAGLPLSLSATGMQWSS